MQMMMSEEEEEEECFPAPLYNQYKVKPLFNRRKTHQLTDKTKPRTHYKPLLYVYGVYYWLLEALMV